MATAPIRSRRRSRPIRVSGGTSPLLLFLGVIEALLVLGLLVTLGLVMALAETRGLTRLEPHQLTDSRIARLPGWVRVRLPNYAAAPGSPRTVQVIPDTGLYALSAAGGSASGPVRRRIAEGLGSLTTVLRPARGNIGSLQLLVITGLILLLAATSIARVRASMAVAEAGRVARLLRNQIHRQSFRLGQSALPTDDPGPVFRVFHEEVDTLVEGLRSRSRASSFAPILGLGLLVMGFLLSPLLATFLLILFALTWLVTRPIAKARDAALEAHRHDAEVYRTLLHEDLGLLRTVRVFGMESDSRNRFVEHLDRFGEAEGRGLVVTGRAFPSALLMYGSASAMAVGVLGANVLWGQITLTTAVLLVATLLLVAWPAELWLERRRHLAKSADAASQIEAFLDRKPELQMANNAKFLPPLKRSIRFEDVRLEAPDGRTLLDGFTAEVPARSRVAIMGFDEEAKHAIACLIPRLIDPSAGKVRIDGQDLRDVTLESLRDQIALVLQADLVFNDTVLRNIGLGDTANTPPRIVEAAKLAHIFNEIQELPRGMETVIGPLGHELTPDQKFRIALARAYLHDPAILVIEEPYNKLDDEVKALIDDTIDRLAPDRTLIFLPHRLSTIRRCDQVFLLHNGRVEGKGAHRELHQQSKVYRHLQYVEFNQFATGEIEAGQMS